jgi:hypothetical protein
MRRILMALGLTSLSMQAMAVDMIGSSLTFLRAYPTTTTPYWANSTQTTTVAAGPTDLIDWYSGPGNTGFHLTVDPEATTITFQLLSGSTFIGSQGTFDGFTVSGFGAALSSVTVASNATGLTVTPSILSPNVLGVSLDGNNAVAGFTLSVTLVPEPSAALMLAAGLLAMAWKRTASRQSARNTV